MLYVPSSPWQTSVRVAPPTINWGFEHNSWKDTFSKYALPLLVWKVPTSCSLFLCKGSINTNQFYRSWKYLYNFCPQEKKSLPFLLGIPYESLSRWQKWSVLRKLNLVPHVESSSGSHLNLQKARVVSYEHSCLICAPCVWAVEAGTTQDFFLHVCQIVNLSSW